MMNEFERAELEAENDGFSNDYQRAFAVSHMRRKPRTNGRAAAETLVAQGLFVAVEFSPEYCSITDGLLGEVCTLVAHGLTREEVVARLSDLRPLEELGDSRFEIWPQVKAPALPVAPETNDIPF